MVAQQPVESSNYVEEPQIHLINLNRSPDRYTTFRQCNGTPNKRRAVRRGRTVEAFATGPAAVAGFAVTILARMKTTPLFLSPRWRMRLGAKLSCPFDQ